MNFQVGQTGVSKMVKHLKISIPELKEMRRKGLLDAEHYWFSFVGRSRTWPVPLEARKLN